MTGVLRVVAWLMLAWCTAVLVVWSARYLPVALALGGARGWWRWRRVRFRERLV